MGKEIATIDKKLTLKSDMSLGEILRELRKEVGLKVYELAEKVKINPTYITQIENYKKLPDPEIFVRILKCLPVSPLACAKLRELYLKNKFPEYQKTDKLLTEFFISRFNITYSPGKKMNLKKFLLSKK